MHGASSFKKFGRKKTQSLQIRTAVHSEFPMKKINSIPGLKLTAKPEHQCFFQMLLIHMSCLISILINVQFSQTIFLKCHSKNINEKVDAIFSPANHAFMYFCTRNLVLYDNCLRVPRNRLAYKKEKQGGLTMSWACD